MFTVYDKKAFREDNIAKEVNVYDVTYDKNGYPLFLVKQDGMWIVEPAKHFLIKEELYGRHTD